MSDLKSRLVELERQFWQGDADFYRKNADEKCLVNFPGMVDVLDNEVLAQSVSSDARWRDIAFEKVVLLRPTDAVTVIAYEATATKGDGDPQTSSVTSGYVERDGAWKLAWHHHVPLSKGA
jgi:hypothetical protein